MIDSLTQKKLVFETATNFDSRDRAYIDVLNALAKSHLRNNHDSTRIYADRSDSLSILTNYKTGQASSKLVQGALAMMQGDFANSINKANQANKIAQNINADSLKLQVLNLLGLAYFLKGDLVNSYPIWQEGKGLAEELGNVKMQIYFISNIASSFSLLRDEELALEYYEKSLKLLKTQDEKLLLATQYANMAELYFLKENYAKSKEYFNLAKPIVEELEEKNVEVFINVILGEMAIAEENLSSAQKYFDRSKVLLMELDDLEKEVQTHLGFAEINFQKANFDLSEEYALNAKKIVDSLKFQLLTIRVDEFLSKLYRIKREPEKALHYLNLAKNRSDSISKSQSKTKFLMIEAENEFKRDKQLAAQESQRKISQRNMIIYATGILILTLSVIVFLVRKNHLNQKSANKKLQEITDTKDKVFSEIGHDLKTPITTLQELLELHKDREISEKELATITPRLKENVDYNSFMLNNLLMWAKSHMEDGLEAFPEKINVKDAINHTKQLFNNEIQKKNITIEINIPENQEITFDKSHLRLILKNLISNALKYSNADNSIQVSTLELDRKLALRIEDYGVGIHQDTIAAINSDSFIQSKPGTEREKGTGLGLQISRTLVTLNGGELEIMGEIGKGTTVTLILPK